MTNKEFLIELEAIKNKEQCEADIANCSSLEEMQSVFSDYGINVTASELEEFSAKIVSSENGEFSEDDLDQVSGGRLNPQRFVWNIGRWIFKRCGTDIGPYRG